MEPRKHPRRVALLYITSNRGMCGAFNSGLNRKTRLLYNQYRQEGLEVDLYAIGKKALGFLKHQGMEAFYSDIQLNETCESDETRRLAQVLMDRFLAGELDRVEVIYSHYVSAGTQEVASEQLLPIKPPRGPEREESETDFIFEPSAAAIIDTLLPMYVQSMVYRVITENIASEQSSRRRAMKQATDNADEMITNLTRGYNRQRQAQITNELTEIIGASAALD
jgi:F-type H+-transporting ATPase subunit gamma